MDRLPCHADREDVRAVARAVALRAADENIAQELHFDLLETIAATAFAAARPGVERERSRRQSLRAGFVRCRENFADRVEDAEVNGGRRARRARERRLIDHHHVGDLFRAGDRATRADGIFIHEPMSAGDVLIQHLMHERALARAGDAAHAREDAERNIHVDVAQIVFARAFDAQPSARRASAHGHGDRLAAGEVIGGEGAAQLVQRAVENEFAARGAATGAEFDEIIRGADHRLLVFDDEQSVSFVAQVLHHADEPARVARMQADAWFVEHEERVHERGAETRREIHALDLAAAQRARRAVEREVAEADFDEVAQTRGDFVLQHLHGRIAVRGALHEEKREQFIDGQRHQLRQRFCREAEVQRRGLVAAAAAVGAGGVSAVAAEQHADVHFVGLRFEPVEKPLHPIPQSLVPQLVARRALALAKHHPVLIRARQLGERRLHIQLAHRRGAQ